MNSECLQTLSSNRFPQCLQTCSYVEAKECMLLIIPNIKDDWLEKYGFNPMPLLLTYQNMHNLQDYWMCLGPFFHAVLFLLVFGLIEIHFINICNYYVCVNWSCVCLSRLKQGHY